MPASDSVEWTEAELAELCSRADYADSDFCRLREPGETPAEFNERQLAEEGAPLEIEITQGQRAGATWAPLAIAVGVGIGLAVLTRGR